MDLAESIRSTKKFSLNIVLKDKVMIIVNHEIESIRHGRELHIFPTGVPKVTQTKERKNYSNK